MCLSLLARFGFLPFLYSCACGCGHTIGAQDGLEIGKDVRLGAQTTTTTPTAVTITSRKK